MATPTTPKTPQVPTAPKAPTAPPAPPMPAPPAAAEKAPKKPRQEWQYYYDNAEAAKKEAEGREGGPRRPFTMKLGDKTVFVVAHNPEHASKLAFEKLGGTIEEIGKEGKSSKKPVDAASILAALGSLPEADQKAIADALASLSKK